MDTPPPLRSEPTSGGRQVRRTASFQFLNSHAFGMIFLILSFCFILVILISLFYSFSFHFFKPQSTRKSLDFLSLALVLFAIACGLLSKNHGGNTVHEEIYRATITSNDSEQSHKSNPPTPNQWNDYADRTDKLLLHHPPEVAGVEYWRPSAGSNMTNYSSLSSDSLPHCQNLKDFEEGFDSKRASRATFSVYDEEISSSFSALHQFYVPPSRTPPQFSSPPVRITPPRTVVEAEVEKVNEGDENFEPELLRQNFQALEVEIRKNEKRIEVEGKETRRNKKNKKKKMKKWQNFVENFNELLTPQQRHYRNLSPPPAPRPPVAVHRYRASSKTDETRRNFQAPPRSPLQKHIAVRTLNSTDEQAPYCALAPPSTAAELQIVMEGETLCTRNENTEIKGTVFCGSPDVNSKADSFIERFRAGLKWERMSWIKERRRKTRTSFLGRKGPEQ